MVRLIQHLYESDRTTVLVENTYSEWFNCTVGVRQGCRLSPTLFNIFLEHIMQDILENVVGGARCGNITINNLRFADDIDLIASNVEELKEITVKLDDTSR